MKFTDIVLLLLILGMALVSFIVVGHTTAKDYPYICDVEARYRWEHYVPARKAFCWLFKPTIKEKGKLCT